VPQKYLKQKMSAAVGLIRKAGTGFELLMLKRIGQLREFPDMYAFPGGKVEEQDLIEKWETQYPEFKPDRRHPDLTYRICAIRELFEETGILVCKKLDGSPVKYQKGDYKTGGDFIAFCKRNGIVPDTAGIQAYIRCPPPENYYW